MKIREFFELYYEATARVFTYYGQPSSRGKIYCGRKEYRVKVSSLYNPLEDMDLEIDRPVSEYASKTFKGWLELINTENGTLTFISSETGKYLDFPYAAIELKPTSYTYQELLDKMEKNK